MGSTWVAHGFRELAHGLFVHLRTLYNASPYGPLMFTMGRPMVLRCVWVAHGLPMGI